MLVAETERVNAMKLEELRDKHKGERCFIIGTGPSLNETPLPLLKNEYCFGCNTLYKGFDKWGINCEYYAFGDVKLWKEHYNKVQELDSIIFLSEEIKNTYPDTIDYRKCFPIRTLPSMWVVKQFSGDLTLGKFSGDNVIIDCLQEAFYLGFEKVYLLGCDCTTEGHFYKDHRDDPGMYEKSGGYHAFSNDWKERFGRALQSYWVCKIAYQKTGREIINCTNGGNLEMFTRMKLEEVLKG